MAADLLTWACERPYVCVWSYNGRDWFVCWVGMDGRAYVTRMEIWEKPWLWRRNLCCLHDRNSSKKALKIYFIVWVSGFIETLGLRQMLLCWASLVVEEREHISLGVPIRWRLLFLEILAFTVRNIVVTGETVHVPRYVWVSFPILFSKVKAL